jgi:peptidoglycan DL-endopeptidase CwlO
VSRAAVIAVCAVALAACASQATRPTQPQAPPSAPPPVAAAETAAVPPLRSGARMADEALSMLGQPYRYGGAEPGGFDCSGLVSYAAKRAGFVVPRTAEDQQHAGVAVARDALQPGDLVFLHLLSKELHVGIAIDSTHFVHAPSSGGRVRIDSLGLRPYAGAFRSARRLGFPP